MLIRIERTRKQLFERTVRRDLLRHFALVDAIDETEQVEEWRTDEKRELRLAEAAEQPRQDSEGDYFYQCVLLVF